MAGKIPSFGDFNIPSDIIDLHEWVSDELIDGEIGSVCTLNFPPKKEACDNCLFDSNTNSSSNIYKTGGPIPFQKYGLCPRCQGSGYLEMPKTEDVRLRVYWDKSTWKALGINVLDPDTTCVVIGYMDDLAKLEKANTILLNSNIANIRKYLCTRNGEALPHGFRRNRYFIQAMKRAGGG
jgi:hypothetical protein